MRPSAATTAADGAQSEEVGDDVGESFCPLELVDVAAVEVEMVVDAEEAAAAAAGELLLLLLPPPPAHEEEERVGLLLPCLSWKGTVALMGCRRFEVGDPLRRTR